MTGLRNWKKKLRDALDTPWDYDFNTDHPDCPQCGHTMDFYGHDDGGDFPSGEGYWKCNSCGFQISENEL